MKNQADFLIIPDEEDDATWELRVSNNGKPDHALMKKAFLVLEKEENPAAMAILLGMFLGEGLSLPGSIDPVTGEKLD